MYTRHVCLKKRGEKKTRAKPQPIVATKATLQLTAPRSCSVVYKGLSPPAVLASLFCLCSRTRALQPLRWRLPVVQSSVPFISPFEDYSYAFCQLPGLSLTNNSYAIEDWSTFPFSGISYVLFPLLAWILT